MDIQEALTFPRSFATEGILQLEDGYSNQVCDILTSLGHKVVRPDKPIGGGQIIFRDESTGTLFAGSDPRKDGCALGY